MTTITWIAHYFDGTKLEHGANGNRPPATYRDIDLDRLTAFEVRRGDKSLVWVDFRDDAGGDPDFGPKRLIWRIRHQQNSRGGHQAFHLVGWQRTVKGRNVQAMLYVKEDGTVILGGQPMEDAPMMHAVKLQPQEA